MTSISSITRQYANKQKQSQKGGALFGLIKDDPTPAAAAVPAPAAQEPAKEKSFLGNLFGSSEPAAPADAASTAAEPVQAPAKEEGKSVLGNLFGSSAPAPADASAPAPADAPASAPAEEPVTEENSTSFLGNLLSSSDKSTSNVDEASASASGSDSGSEDDDNNEVDFDFISQKMNKLRENYDALKKEHAELKSKLETEQAEAKKLDDSKVSTLIAAFTASQGALTAFKEALIDHLKNNNYPVDGLESVPQESSSTVQEENEEAPAPAPAPEAVSETVPEAGSEAGSETGSEAVSEAESETGSEAEQQAEPETGSEAEQQAEQPADQQADQQAVPDAVPEAGSEAVSVSSSDSETEHLEEPSSLPEIPVNEEVPTNSSESVPSPAVPAAPASSTEGQTSQTPTQTTPGSIEGGRSHYVHSSNRKATTHRHHKRRNRHQTLRK